MKKLIALVLFLFVALSLVACGGKNDVDVIGDMFMSSRPTKTVVATTQSAGDVVLEAQHTLTTGLVGGRAASVLVSEVDRALSVEEAGASNVVVGTIVTDTELREYVEGKGVRVNNGKWDSNGENFANPEGPVSLNLSSALITSFEYKDNIFRCIISKDNTAEVLGLEEDLPVPVTLEITDDGAVVTSVIISYTVPADDEAQVAETEITIKAFYFYDIQNIEIK